MQPPGAGEVPPTPSGAPPTPTSATTLFPLDTSTTAARLSTASSIGGLYDNYLASPTGSTSSSFGQQQDEAITTARLRRRSSTSSILSTADAAALEGGDHLHRRTSSRVRSQERAAQREREVSPDATRGEAGVAGAAGGGATSSSSTGNAPTGPPSDARRRAEVGWGGHSSPVKPSGGSDWRDRARSATEGAVATSSARPRTPPQSQQGSTGRGSSIDFATTISDPLQSTPVRDAVRPLPRTPPDHFPATQRPGIASTSSSGDMFDPQYSLGSTPSYYASAPYPSISRSDSHPFSLASTQRYSSSDDSDDDAGDIAVTSRHPVTFSDDIEELEARSPLQPASSSPPQTRSTSLRNPFLSSPRTIRGNSVSSTRRSPTHLSPNNNNTSTTSNLSPTGSPSLARRPSIVKSGANLVRRSTLTVATEGLRRASLRVVNLTGAPADLTNEASPVRRPSVKRDDAEAGVGGGTSPRRGDGDAEDEKGDEKEDEVDLDPVQEYEKSFKALRGKTLGVFGPESWFRKSCAHFLTFPGTEPLILVLIILSVVVLTIQSSPNVYEHPRPTSGYFHAWEDYTLFAIFIVFTVEIAARIVVTGLVRNPPLPAHMGSPPTTSQGSPVASRYSPFPPPSPSSGVSPNTLGSLSRRVRSKLPSPSRSPTSHHFRYPPQVSATNHNKNYASIRDPFATSSTTNLVDDVPSSPIGAAPPGIGLGLAGPIPLPPSTTYSATKAHTPFVLSVKQQRATYQQAFLRHSWNRVDLVAVTSFWICFVLAQLGLEAQHNIYIFRALSVLRAMRLLAVTGGTGTILQSLKKAAPQLVNVALFVAFAMSLFSIIGVQSFQGSFRRTCQWVDPAGVLDSVTFGSQHCGGYINATGDALGFLYSTGSAASESSKGFLCPYPSICIETENPDNGSMSFDNIFAALLQVVIVASANTWTGIMYSMMDADTFYACLFFIVGLVVLAYWALNLFVSVILHAFSSILDETKHSAFAPKVLGTPTNALGDDLTRPRAIDRTTSFVRTAYDKTRYIWVLLALATFATQAARQYDAPESEIAIFDKVELGITLAFDFEMLVRAFASLPEWRTLFTERHNLVDLILAVVTTLMQIPVIKNSPAQPWLTAFQLARFYRVIIAIPRMRKLLVRVLGTTTALFNTIMFLLLMTFVSALIAVQLFRGVPDIDSDDTTAFNFFQIFNSFLSMYQILSSENWTDVLNNVLSSERGLVQTFIAAVFLAGWMLFAYSILMNLFISVIAENFSVAEAEKRKQQAEAFANRSEPKTAPVSFFARFNPYNYVQAKQDRSVADAVSSSAAVPLKVLIQDFAMEPPKRVNTEASMRPSTPAFMSKARKALHLSIEGHSGVVMDNAPRSPNESYGPEYQGHLFPATNSAERELQQARTLALERRQQMVNFIAEHPTYDRSLWILSQSNPLRRFCQRFVDPAHGDERLGGQAALPLFKLVFQSLVLVAIVGSLVVAALATPLYRRDYYLDNGFVRWNWFTVTEAGLASVFVAEFAVKVIADGFVFSPNAYALNLYNLVDFFVLATLLVNVITSLIGGLAVNRFTRALKAFRALRLINLWPSMRTTFYNVLIVGFARILDASVLAVLYIIPFAIWGKNIFGGLLYSCNDSSVTTKAECAGEFLSSAVSDWDFYQPRVWSNPSVWSFDTFQSSLLILFEIISLEGWVDVQQSVMTIVGRDMQPQDNASQFNSLFFIGYHLLGAGFILALFVSAIIANFDHLSGLALLTVEQRQWIDLRRLILRAQPAKRPKHRPVSAFRGWCFDRTIQKHGWWARTMTALYCLQTIVLMTQATSNAAWADAFRNYTFLILTLIYLLDIVIRITGIGWRSFRQNGWHLYDLFVVVGTFSTTIPILLGSSSQVAVQLQKLFLVAITFKLVQKNDNLNVLFKTAVASVPAILNIFALWITCFLVFAILTIEVFGLTRWGSAGTSNANYSTFWKAMVLLALQSTGEGWNEFMHNYTVESPLCTSSYSYLFSDCGSSAWAYALFITWNVLSMYLMANLVLGAVVHNFSYVFRGFGRVRAINREEMRLFKKTWAQFDPQRTGYLRRKDLVRFLARLTGPFDVKVFRSEWSVRSLQAAASTGIDPYSFSAADPTKTPAQDRIDRGIASLDLGRLNHALNTIDYKEVRRRKRAYNRLYHEVMIEAEADPRGISFTSMLLVLAHYRLIDDEKALRLEELIDRRERVEQVMDRVNSDNVRTLIRTMFLRREYKATQAALRRERGGAAGVPEINVVDPDDSMEAPTPPRSTRSSLAPLDTSMSSTRSASPESPLGSRSRPAVTFANDPPPTLSFGPRADQRGEGGASERTD